LHVLIHIILMNNNESFDVTLRKTQIDKVYDFGTGPIATGQ